MTEEKILRTAVTLEGDVLKKFLEIKKRLGIQSNTDTLRLLIVGYYNIIKETK